MNANVAANRTVFEVEPLTVPCVNYRRACDEQVPGVAFTLDPKFALAVQRIALALHSLAAANSRGVACGTVALRIGATRLFGRIAIVADTADISAPVPPRAHIEALSVRN